MKQLIRNIIIGMILSVALAGCATARVSEKGDYSTRDFEIEVPLRGAEVPASVVMPVGKGRFPLVLMAHGHGGTRDENGGFADIAETLAKHGMAVVRMDFPGCGASGESFQMNTLSNMIEDVDAVGILYA